MKKYMKVRFYNLYSEFGKRDKIDRGLPLIKEENFKRAFLDNLDILVKFIDGLCEINDDSLEITDTKVGDINYQNYLGDMLFELSNGDKVLFNFMEKEVDDKIRYQIIIYHFSGEIDGGEIEETQSEPINLNNYHKEGSVKLTLYRLNENKETDKGDE